MNKRNPILVLLSLTLVLILIAQPTVALASTNNSPIERIYYDQNDNEEFEVAALSDTLTIFLKNEDASAVLEGNMSGQLKTAYITYSDQLVEVPLKNLSIDVSHIDPSKIKETVRRIIHDNTPQTPTTQNPDIFTTQAATRAALTKTAIDISSKEYGGLLVASWWAKGTYYGVTGNLYLHRSHLAKNDWNNFVDFSNYALQSVSLVASIFGIPSATLASRLISLGIAVVSSGKILVKKGSDSVGIVVTCVYEKYVKMANGRIPYRCFKEVEGVAFMTKSTAKPIGYQYSKKIITGIYNSSNQDIIKRGCYSYVNS